MNSPTDWENLMNSVFASGGSMTKGYDSKPTKGKPEADAGLTALKNNADAMDEALKKQAEEIARLSSSLTGSLRQDGLLENEAIPAKAEPVDARKGFEGLTDTLAAQVQGQPQYLKKLTMAFRRPFVMGTEAEEPKNTILIYGPSGTGRHYALACLADELKKRGVLASGEVRTVDLGKYPGPAQEKLFLQDLFAALRSESEIVVFDHYAECHPGFLRQVTNLFRAGKVDLGSRYVLQKGMLVDAGTALVPDAVASLTAKGKYLVLFSDKGPEKVADVLGAGLIGSFGDICCTEPFETASLQAIAAQQLNSLAQKVKKQLGITLVLGADVRDEAAGKADTAGGAVPVIEYIGRIYKALSQYTLENDPAPGGKMTLTAEDGTLKAAFETVKGEKEEPFELFGLLPGEYSGALEQVQKEMESIVGLDEIKNYVLGLADNVQVQRRRKEQGMKTAGLNMHMIFAGNPGTGKTTIARIVGRYLKAIGALKGGQLIEVSRADLVGRYVGHTAPLTNQVIESALGGVLFVDEAYSLFRGREDSFGLEAIDTLVKGIEDHRDELVVILAGYSKEMKTFLEANSGLASRFPNFIEFPDYTGEQLLKITHITAKSKGYRMDAGCDMPLLAYYNRRQAEDAATAGNGRLARNTLEAAILNQSRRLVADKNAPLDELLWTDFDLGDSEEPEAKSED